MPGRDVVRTQSLYRSALVLIALSVVGWRSPWVRDEVRLSVTREPSRFTQLYFSDPAGLPKYLSTVQPNEVLFTIVNSEDRPMTYIYRVTVQAEEAPASTLAERSASIAPGTAANEDVAFTPAATGNVYLITVDLVGRQETIDFTGQS